VRTKGLLRNIGDEVRERRMASALSQEALAHQAGLHRNVVGRLESGRYNPTVLTLHAIAVKLDVPLHELLTSAARRS
jgi:putative transcriptional regulator